MNLPWILHRRRIPWALARFSHPCSSVHLRRLRTLECTEERGNRWVMISWYHESPSLPSGSQTRRASKWTTKISDFPSDRNLHSVTGDFPASHDWWNQRAISMNLHVSFIPFSCWWSYDGDLWELEISGTTMGDMMEYVAISTRCFFFPSINQLSNDMNVLGYQRIDLLHQRRITPTKLGLT